MVFSHHRFMPSKQKPNSSPYTSEMYEILLANISTRNLRCCTFIFAECNRSTLTNPRHLQKRHQYFCWQQTNAAQFPGSSNPSTTITRRWIINLRQPWTMGATRIRHTILSYELVMTTLKLSKYTYNPTCKTRHKTLMGLESPLVHNASVGPHGGSCSKRS